MDLIFWMGDSQGSPLSVKNDQSEDEQTAGNERPEHEFGNQIVLILNQFQLDVPREQDGVDRDHQGCNVHDEIKVLEIQNSLGSESSAQVYMGQNDDEDQCRTGGQDVQSVEVEPTAFFRMFGANHE